MHRGGALRRRLLGAVAALCLIVLVGTALLVGAPGQDQPDAPSTSAAPAGARPAVGVHFHGTWSEYTDEQRLERLDAMAGAGVEWVRIDLGWASYEEECSGCLSEWYVERADLVIDAARARGLKVLAQVGMVPDWANGGRGTAAPPADPREFGRFMRWLGAHLDGRVDAYELWNEPNLDRFWEGSVDDFVELVAGAYSAVKAVDPDAPVVLGGVSYNDTEWLDRAYEAGVGDHFDVLGTHPYQVPSNAGPQAPDEDGTDIYVLRHVATVRDLMVLHGDEHKDIWFTELGWSTRANTGTEDQWEIGVTEQQQADHLRSTIELVTEEFPYVAKLFWYEVDDAPDSERHQDRYGLLRADGAPKPAYEALQDELAARRTVRGG